MLPSINKLPLRLKKELLESTGQSFSTTTLTAIIAPDQESSPSRFAFIASKKISPKAVIRNRLRRRVLNLLHPFLPHLKSHYSILLLAKHPLLTASSSQITSDLKTLLIKAGLLNH